MGKKGKKDAKAERLREAEILKKRLRDYGVSETPDNEYGGGYGSDCFVDDYFNGGAYNGYDDSCVPRRFPPLDIASWLRRIHIYAIGRIKWRWSNRSVEEEVGRAIGNLTKDEMESLKKEDRLTEAGKLHYVLSRPENRYLARRSCWALTHQGVETYILQPRDPADYGLLVDAICPPPPKSPPSKPPLRVVVGVRGPLTPPQACGGLRVHAVTFDRMFPFQLRHLVAPNGVSEAAAAELFDRIEQLTDNKGAKDRHRALNYLAVNHLPIYETFATGQMKNASLTGVEARPSRLSGDRRIVDVIFAYTDRGTTFVEKYIVRVDVTEEFPFLVSGLSRYVDH